MVARQSQEIQINQAQGTTIQQSSMGAAPVDVAKFGKSYDISSGQPDASSSRLLSSILEVGGKLANQLADRSIEEAYLDGVAKAGTLKEESDLQGNPLTKDWQTAGYRDTMGKLAAADREADIALSIKKLRNQSPEKFNEYLTQTRQEFLPKLEGMSFEQRKSMFAQQIFSERAAIKKHATENYAYVAEEKNKVLNAGYNRMEEAMDLAKRESPNGDARAAYSASVDSTFAYVRSVFADTSLPDSTRSGLLAQFAHRAIESGNLDVYKAVTERTVEYPDGSKRPMSDSIDYEERIKLSKAYTAAMDKTAGLRAQNYIAELVDVRSSFEDPARTIPTHAELIQVLNRGMANHPEYMTESRYGEVLGDWVKAGVKRGSEQGVAQAFAKGDINALYSLTKGNIGEGLSTWSRVVGSKLPVIEATRELARIGLDTGQVEAFAEMGKLSKAGWAAMSTSNTINPDHAQMIESTMNFFDKAQGKHMDGALSQYLTAFSPDDQSFILDVKANYANGLKGEAAVSLARDKFVENNKMAAPLRSALQAKATQENVALLGDFKPQGPLDQVYNMVAQLASSNASADRDIQAQVGFFKDAKVTALMQMQVGPVSREVLETITRENPTADAAKRLELTKSRMASMVVPVKGVPFFVPLGQTPASFFGIKADTRAIANALSAEAPASAKGNFMAYGIDRLGNLTATEYTKEGGYARQPWHVDRGAVRTRIEAADRERQADYNATAGAGLVRNQVYNGVKAEVRYNGDNSANISNRSMLEFRTALTEHEAIRTKVYADTTGVLTNGVGVSTKNTWYPKPDANGNITQEQLNTSFLRASDDAAKIATRAMTTTRRVNDASFKLLADLAYQAGGQVATGSEYKALRDAMAAGDANTALTALQSTKAWDYGRSKERRAYRTKLLFDALKG